MGKSMWDAVGIRTTVDIMEQLAARDRARAGSFDIYFVQATPNPDPDQQVRFSLSAMARLTGPIRTLNWTSASPRGSLYDPKERQKIYERCIRIIQEMHLGSGYLLPANKSPKSEGLKWHGASRRPRDLLDK